MKGYSGTFKKLGNAEKKINSIVEGFKVIHQDIKEKIYTNDFNSSKCIDLFVQEHFIGRIYLTDNYKSYQLKVI